MSDRQNLTAEFFKSCRIGFDRLSVDAQMRMREAISNTQDSSGLFIGRHGSGDLYYTFFGLLLAAVTNAKIDLDTCKRTVTAIDIKTLDLVHGCAWLRVQRLLKFLSLPSVIRSNILNHFTVKADRTERQIIASFHSLAPNAFPQSDPNSPYSLFLLMTIHADFGLDYPEVNIRPYCLHSGLYANFRNDIEYAVNATTSALFLISKSERQQTINALIDLQQNDGSFKAVGNAPCSDLLSTGTAIFALTNFNMSHKRSAKSFLRTCIREDGLFGATSDDPGSDLEYTVYALLSLGGS